MSDARPPVVTDLDRKWALEKCPSWVQRRPEGETAPDDGLDADGYLKPRPQQLTYWDDFVCEQAERFESFHAFDRRSPEAWSRLWRVVWWPKADAARRFPKSAPKAAPGDYPVFRKGSAEFDAALRVATRTEAKLWAHLGSVMFKSGDPRLERIRALASGERQLSDRSRRMSGDDR